MKLDPLYTLRGRGHGHGHGRGIGGGGRGISGSSSSANAAAAVSSLCFLRPPAAVAAYGGGDHDDTHATRPPPPPNSNGDHDDEGPGPGQFTRTSPPPPPLLLASCDTLGNAFVWNLSTRRVVAQFGYPTTTGASSASASASSRVGRTGPGLALRRFSSSPSPADDDDGGSSSSACGRFLYQTRGTDGVVSVHDCRYQHAATSTSPISPISTSTSKATPTSTSTITSPVRLPAVYEVRTHSRSFCAASPCRGDPNLFVAPSGGSDGGGGGSGSGMATAGIYDVRKSSASSVVRTLHGALGVFATGDGGGGGGGGYRGRDREHGMLTSLAMSSASATTACGVDGGENEEWGGGGGYVVACGMESGAVFFHDLRGSTTTATTAAKCSVSLGGEPVLALDLFPSTASPSPSSPRSRSRSRSVAAIAGCAGDAADLSALPPDERGPAAILRATFPPGPDGGVPTARIGARLDTCKVGGGSVGGKPGVGCCSFRGHDGRLCAVGGWDGRARIFDARRNGRPLAVLRGGHGGGGGGGGGGVTCLDWCPPPPTPCGETGPRGDGGDGLVATGSSDGKIRIWRVYPSSSSSSSTSPSTSPPPSWS